MQLDRVAESKPAAVISITSSLVTGTGTVLFASGDTEELQELQWLVWNIIRARVRKINSLLGREHELPDLAKSMDLQTKTAPYGSCKSGGSGMPL